MLALDASLTVTLRVEGGTVAAVDIASSRRPDAARFLAGRAAATVPQLLATVFSLCGTAQALAALRAIEAASRRHPSAPHRMARRVMALGEILSEHLLAMARDWPALIGDPPDLATAKQLRPTQAALRKGLYPDGDWHRPGGGRLDPDQRALNRCLRDFAACAEAVSHHATALPRRIEAEGLAGFGRSPIGRMPANGPADLAQRLTEDTDGAYLARPDCAGKVLETGPLSRQAMTAPVARALHDHGNGLAARFIARRMEMAAALHEMESLVHDLCQDGAGEIADATAAGLGLAEAARGLLAHRVELENGIVRRYQILAPTEWNFHPAGPFAQGLLGAADHPELERHARLLAAALDPCVACAITVDRHA